MTGTHAAFCQNRHAFLVNALAEAGYADRYFSFCAAYPIWREMDGPRLDMAETAGIFKANKVRLDWSKRFRVFTFDTEEISGWVWQGKLVVQRYDMLEPMIEGHAGSSVIGSTMLSLADDAGQCQSNPMSHPPGSVERPRFDGDMRTMERMVPDLIKLFRFVKDIVRASWPATPAFEHED